MLVFTAHTTIGASIRSQALANYRESRYEEAARLYQQILQTEPQNEDLLRDFMWILWKSERFDESEKVAAVLLEIHKDDLEATRIVQNAPTMALRAKAASFYRTGRFDLAGKIYQELAEKIPTNTSILKDLMWSLWKTEKYDQVLEVANRILALRKDDREAKEMLQKATMFVPLANVEGRLPPSYASWNMIKKYRDTGRWEIQAHGDQAHVTVPVDADGRGGLFLINKEWLAEQKRFETPMEFEDRVADDHASVKAKIASHLGSTPNVYAFPEGSYGQTDYINFPDAAPINLSEARRSFEIAFHQDDFGFNARSRDPVLMTRTEPRLNWSGARLVRHLHDANPRAYFYAQLLHRAVWRERVHEAEYWLGKLKENGASQLALLGEEARIRSFIGDDHGGSELVKKGMSIEQRPQDEALLSAMKRPLWNPGFTHTEDNRHRINSVLEQTFVPFPAAAVRWSIDYRHAELKEKNTPDAIDDGAGVTVSKNLSLYHRLTGNFMWHWTKRGGDTISASGGLRSNWTDAYETNIQGGRSLYDTARALNASISENYAKLENEWKQDGPWWAALRLQGADISDGNRRAGAEASVSDDFLPQLRGIYKYTFDHTKDVSPDYYSPQHLNQHQLGLEFTMKNAWSETTVDYLPGLGKETGTRTEFIQEAEAAISLHIGPRTRLRPNYALTKTPTYRRQTHAVQLRHQF